MLPRHAAINDQAEAPGGLRHQAHILSPLKQGTKKGQSDKPKSFVLKNDTSGKPQTLAEKILMCGFFFAQVLGLVDV